MPQRSYSYARISTGGDQAEGDGLRRQQGLSNDDREPWPVSVSREQGWFLDDTLKFTDSGRSGYHQKNLSPTADLTRFLTLVQRGSISRGSVLIIEQIDRLSRAAVDEAYDLFRSILKSGIWICTKIPFRIYRPDADSGFMDIMEPLWIMYVAWMESEKKSERAAAAWDTARKMAREKGTPLPGRRPFWLKQGESSVHSLIPEKARAVLRAHELCQAGMGACRIRTFLEEEGYPPPGKKPWCEATVQWLLRTRATRGEYRPERLIQGKKVAQGDPICDFYPPIIAEEMWLRSQQATAFRRAVRGRPGSQMCNSFLGIAYDAVSRKRLVIRSKGRGPGKLRKKYPYLTSHNVGGLRVPYEPFESCVVDAVSMLREEDVLDRPKDCDERERRILALTSEILGLEKRAKDLQDAAKDTLRDITPILEMAMCVNEERKTKAAERDRLKLESKSGRSQALGECQQLGRMLRDAEGDEKKELQEGIRSALPGVVSSIWVQAQRVALRSQIVHVQIWLHSGECRNVHLSTPNTQGVVLWQLENLGIDLRRGPYIPDEEVAHATSMASEA